MINDKGQVRRETKEEILSHYDLEFPRDSITEEYEERLKNETDLEGTLRDLNLNEKDFVI